MRWLFVFLFITPPSLAATCNETLITPPFSLHTSRLELRFLTHDDIPELVEMHAIPEIAKVNKGERDFDNLKKEADWNGKIEESVFVLSLGIMFQEKLIGVVSFYMMHTEMRVGTIGYVLLPEYWGRGIASEAVVALIDFCKNNLPMRLNTLEAQVARTNRRSIRLLRRLGFHYSRDSAERELIFARAI